MRVRWIILAVAIVLAAGLSGGVWLLQSVLDWGQYRNTIASLAAERLGRPVRIGGAVTLRLVPQPILQAADVSIDDAGDGFGLHARALRLRVGLASLLTGTVDARELTVEGADVRLPWPLPAALLPRWQARSTGLRVRVEQSRLQVGGFVLDKIDAGLTVDPETGTLSVAGAGAAGGQRWQFTARLAQPGGDGAAGLDLSLDGQGALQDTGGTFSGQVAADGALTGRVAGRGPDLSALMPAPALPWRGDGRLTVSVGLAVVDELALEVGGTPVRGAVKLRIGALRVRADARLDLTLAAGRIDLDAWLPTMVALVGVRGGVPMGVNISVEAATLAGGTLRRLRGAMDLDARSDGGMELREVTALLPGDASLAVSGHLTGGAAAHFDGTVRLDAPDLPATVRWAQPLLVPGVPMVAGLPRAANVQGRLTVDGLGGTVSELHGTLDGGAVAGTVTLRRGVRTRVLAELDLARLTLDPWIAGVSSDGGMTVANEWRAVDADVRLRVDAAEWAGVALGALALDAEADAARVVVRRLEVAPMGARVLMSGQLGEAGRVTDGRLEASAPDLGLLRPLLARLPRPPAALERLLRGPGSLVVTVAGPVDALAGQVTAELGDLRLDATPVVNLGTRGFTGALALHHPGAPRLLETLGLGNTAAWLGDGSFSLVGQFEGGPGRLNLVSARLGAGALRMGGQLAFEGRRISGRLVAETVPLPVVYMRSPEPLPYSVLRAWSGAVRVEAAEVLVGVSPLLTHVVSEVALDGGVLTVRLLAGQMLGGTLDGTLAVDATVDPLTVGVKGRSTGLGITGPVFGTPVDVVAGLVDGVVDLSGAGYSPATLLATLSGTADITVHDGTASGFDLDAAAAALTLPSAQETLAAARQALTTGSTRIGRLDAHMTFARGVAGIEAGLAEANGRVRLGGSFDVAGQLLDARLLVVPTVADGGAGPELRVRLSGGGTGVTSSPELAGLARWLAERPEAP